MNTPINRTTRVRPVASRARLATARPGCRASRNTLHAPAALKMATWAVTLRPTVDNPGANHATTCMKHHMHEIHAKGKAPVDQGLLKVIQPKPLRNTSERP
jgi:hypothetical protein